MDIESFFLSKLKASGITENINDDCALLNFYLKNKKKYIIATDSFIENSHFKIAKDSKNRTNYNQWLSYENLTKKAFLVNISDIISSGGLAKYALLSISLPKNITKIQILEIINAIKEICLKFNIKLIGGDTASSDTLAFHITLIGELKHKYLQRSNVKNGDFVAYTSIRNGNLGRSFKALKNLLRFGANINKLPQNFLEIKSAYSKFAAPILRDSFLFKAQKKIHSCMDISDGLAQDIKRLEKLNRLHFLPFKNIPPHIYQSGEEYELLFTFNPKNLVALKRLAAKSRIALHIIGKFGRFRQSIFNSPPWH